MRPIREPGPRYTSRMIALTSRQRRELRAQAHALHPVVSVGQQGLTPRVIHEIDVALRAHALVKVRVFSEDRRQRDAMLAQIAGELDAAPVQHLGKVLIVWRKPEEKAVEPAPRPKRKAVKQRTRAGSKRTSSKRMDSEPHTTKRRERGSPSVALPKPASEARRRTTSSPPETARAPRGRSAPNPRRRRAG